MLSIQTTVTQQQPDGHINSYFAVLVQHRVMDLLEESIHMNLELVQYTSNSKHTKDIEVF